MPVKNVTSKCFDTASPKPPPYEVKVHECAVLTACGLAEGETLPVFRDVCGVKKLHGTLTAETSTMVLLMKGTYCFNPGEYAGRVFVECAEDGIDKVVAQAIAGGATPAPLDPAALAVLSDILAKLCAPLSVELTEGSVAALENAFAAAIEGAEFPELTVTVAGGELTVNGTVALDADTLAALEDINATVSGTVDIGNLDALAAAIAAALDGLEVSLSGADIAALAAAIAAAIAAETLTVTVEGGNITVDGTVDIGNIDDLANAIAEALDGLNVVVSGTVSIDGPVALDPDTIAALTVKRKEFSQDMKDAEGNKWRVCVFVNINDVTDVVGPIVINPDGVPVAEAPEGLVPCVDPFPGDFTELCPSGPPGSDPTRGFQYINGRPQANVPWQLCSNFDGQNDTVVIEGATLPEFIANMEAAGYTEWSNAEQHYFCPCPPGYTEAGSYTIKVDGETTVKVDCLPLAELPNAPEKTTEDKPFIRVLEKNSAAVLAAINDLKAEAACRVESRPVCVDSEGEIVHGFAVVKVSAETTEVLRIEDAKGVAIEGECVDCCAIPNGKILSGKGESAIVVSGDFSGAETLEVVNTAGVATVMQVASVEFNAVKNTTAITLTEATAVTSKFVKRVSKTEAEK